MEADEYAKTIADALEAAGVTPVDQGGNFMSHVGWGDKFAFDGHMEGVHTLTVQQGEDLDCWITIETRRFHDTRHFNLGHAIYKPGRTRSTLWHIAFGYVNGFPLKDILWYVLTRRWFPPRRPREWTVIDLDELTTN